MKAEAIYEKVTAQLVAALEDGAHGAKWRAPWHAAAFLPTNASTGVAYRGGNVVVCWSTTYGSQWWATYRQWEQLGGQVRKGERSTHLVRWIVPPREDEAATEEVGRRRRAFPKGFAVFNAEQVDGWTPPPPPAPIDRDAQADAFFAAIGARVVPGQPAYLPQRDVIAMPDPDAFTSAEGYYATLGHEHVHWTGHGSRCDRNLLPIFGTERYAREELVAELGSAFLGALLGIEAEPREDHAHYLASWISALRGDSHLLFKAATEAQRAVDYLVALAAGQHADIAAWGGRTNEAQRAAGWTTTKVPA